jgi:hypothetical protein
MARIVSSKRSREKRHTGVYDKHRYRPEIASEFALWSEHIMAAVDPLSNRGVS